MPILLSLCISQDMMGYAAVTIQNLSGLKQKIDVISPSSNISIRDWQQCSVLPNLSVICADGKTTFQVLPLSMPEREYSGGP